MLTELNMASSLFFSKAQSSSDIATFVRAVGGRKVPGQLLQSMAVFQASRSVDAADARQRMAATA